MMISLSSLLRMLRRPSCRRAAAILFGCGLLGIGAFYGSGIFSGFSVLWSGWAPAQPPPSVSMTAPPILSGSGALLLSYQAYDDSSVEGIALRVTSQSSMPGANNVSVEIPLATQASKKVSGADTLDLTSQPWAGQKVTLQIVATNKAGKRSLSDAVEFALPQRRFSHPVARVLIEEREKLMRRPDDPVQRDEAANVMASIAHDPATYGGDLVVLMALRSGAVRLVLEHDRESAISVNDILWNAAARIEDGNPAPLRHSLRDTSQDLAMKISRLL